MKQVVQNFRTGELKIDSLPPPALRPGGVLAQTAYSLISAGTERSIVETAQSSLVGKARSRPDLVRQVLDTLKREGALSTYTKVKARLNQIKPLGYSASGVVIAVGSDTREFQVGDRVACAGAGYASHAEVIFVPGNLCCKLPASASLESACYTTVGAIALHGVRQSDARLGESVAVIGLGLVGQLTVQILKAAGCRVVGIDIDREACELAKKSGADIVACDYASARAAVDSLTDGRGADCVLITASAKSNEPIELAGQVARDRARVVVVGLVRVDVPRHTFYAKELELRHSRSYGPGRYDPGYEEKGNDYPIGYVRWTEKRNMEAFLRLVAEGKIDTQILTTHRFAIDQAADAYNLIVSRDKHRYCGIILDYSSGDDSRLDTAVARAPSVVAADEIGVGFIGAGNFARGVLLPAVKRYRKARLVGVATATGVSAKNTAEQYGFAYSTTDYARLLDDDTTRCIFIATRHDSHSMLAAEALRRGKSVFVEKPLATTEEGLREVAAAAQQTDSLLAVGYNRRFAPLAVEVKQRLRDRAGAMTIIYRVNAGQLAPDHWSMDSTEGGGRVIGEVCHFVDFVQFLTDSLPARVCAESAPRDRKVGFIDDSVAITLSLTDGSIASIIYAAGGDASVAKERIEIFSDRSVAVIDDFKKGQFIRGSKNIALGGGSQDKGHAAEIKAFFDAARGLSERPIALDSLIATSLTCFAIVECAKGGAGMTIDARSMMF